MTRSGSGPTAAEGGGGLCKRARGAAGRQGPPSLPLSLNSEAGGLPTHCGRPERAGEERGGGGGLRFPKPPCRPRDSSAGRTLPPYPGAGQGPTRPDAARRGRAGGRRQMTLERAQNHMTARATRTHSRPQAGRDTARARGDHAGLPQRPRRAPAACARGGAGRAGRGRGGGSSCRRAGEVRRGNRDGWEQAGFGPCRPAGGWVFTLMHRDAAAVPVAINQRVLGPASLV